MNPTAAQLAASLSPEERAKLDAARQSGKPATLEALKAQSRRLQLAGEKGAQARWGKEKPQPRLDVLELARKEAALAGLWLGLRQASMELKRVHHQVEHARREFTQTAETFQQAIGQDLELCRAQTACVIAHFAPATAAAADVLVYVCAELGTKPEYVCKKRREAERVAMRDEVIRELRDQYGWSLQQIGAALGGFDHGTISASLKRTENREAA